MSDPETDEIIRLQQLLIKRLDEVGNVKPRVRDNLARELAHVAVLWRAFSEKSLPLFLSMDPRHKPMLQTLVATMKRDMDELRDAIQDLEPDFSGLIESFDQNEAQPDD